MWVIVVLAYGSQIRKLLPYVTLNASACCEFRADSSDERRDRRRSIFARRYFRFILRRIQKYVTVTIPMNIEITMSHVNVHASKLEGILISM